MGMGFGGSVVCPVIIGRETQLDALKQRVEQARAGRGQTLLLTGEAGIGKTRLAEASKALAHANGFQVLEGHCFEPDRGLPYAPLLDLLHSYPPAKSSSRIANGLPSPGEFIKLLHELDPRLPKPNRSPALEPEQEKRRLFQTLTQFIAHLSESQPLQVVIEDLHWCDDTSLDFLIFLTRQLSSLRVLLLLTYRSEETHPALIHFLAELDRKHLAAELLLTPLTFAEVDAMIRMIFSLDRPVRAEFLEPIYALTEGNPFFIEETLKSLIAAGEIFYADGTWDRKPMRELHIPRSVQDAVTRRLDHLDETAQQTLALAAVAGRRFDFALVLELTKMNELELVRTLKALIGAQLVVEESTEQFAFRHALTREAVYTTLLRRERKELHRHVAETLERIHASSIDGYLADLAYHYHEAEVWGKALEYSRRAGEKAQSMYAPQEALQQFTRALEAAEHLTFTRAPSTDLPRREDGGGIGALHHARGQAYETIGDFESARVDYEHALSAATAAQDQKAEWQALLDLGFLWASRDYARTGDYFQQALSLARTMKGRQTLAHTLNRVGNWYVNIEQPHEALRYHREALEIFQELHDREGLAETFDLLGLASEETGDMIQTANYYSQAIALFRELDDRVGLSSSLVIYMVATESYFTSVCVPAPGTLADAMAGVDESLRLARESGWRAGECYALGTPSIYLGPYGEYDRALSRGQEALRIAEEIEHRQWMAIMHSGLGWLYLDLLAPSEARRHLEQGLALAQQVRSLIGIHMASAVLASTCILQNDLSRAESVLKDALGAAFVRFIGPDQGEAHGGPLTVSQRLCLAALAELELARDDPTGALRVVEHLIATTPNLTPDTVIPRLWALRGQALTRLKRFPEAESVLEAARGEAAKLGLKPLQWRIHHALGKVYQAQDRRKDADAQYAEARVIIQELADKIGDAGVREQFLQGVSAALPRPRPLTPHRAEKERYGGLTGREREIAVLIAEGKSNREVADKLVLSERTVVVHIASIMNKFGFTSRTQIAVWAVESGLAPRHPDRNPSQI